MKKRLRKKLKKGEFKELGFEVGLTFKEGATEEEIEQYLDDLIAFMESHNLGMGCRPHQFLVSSLKPRVSCTERDRTLVREWLEAYPLVEKVEVEPLSDSNYGPWKYV